MPPRVPIFTTEVVNGQEAECVGNGSGIVKTLRLEKCGNQSVRKVTEKFGNVTGQVGQDESG